MPLTVKDMLAAANAEVPRLSAEQARQRLQAGDALVVDVRDGQEVRQTGKIKGAVNVPRGMLEFRADPDNQYNDPAFRKDRPVMLYCGSGGRAALAGKTLKDMGYSDVVNVGGFKELAEAGIETEPG